MADSGIYGLFGERMDKFLRDDDEFTLFFNAVGLWLNCEIDKVNSNSSGQSIEGVNRKAVRGKKGVRKLLSEPTFELTSNNGRRSFVRLSLLTSSIEAEIENSRLVQSNGALSISFRLENMERGAKAFCLDMKNGNPIEKELRPEEVAGIVVEAVIRGYFI